ncbi:MAG: radical SAM protein [Candidatus Eisenbacteria bacterium]|nr:radical SAM protein [Candidatus Eisenbacteria bacterium]
MKITLVQPKAYRHNPSFVWEPLNLGYLASFLKANGFSDVSIRISAFEDADAIAMACAESDIAGITGTSPMFSDGMNIARKAKRHNPNLKIVFGGTHATACTESVLLNDEVDFVVRNEGELTLLDLVRTLEGNGDVKNVLGISYRDGSGIRSNPPRPLVKNTDELPPPDRKLFDQEKFIRTSSQAGKRTIWVLSSRGCPYRCTYCASHTVWTRMWRPRSPENVIKEIEELVRDYGIEHVNFSDDTFTVTKERTIEFSRKLKESGLKITWGCNVHVNTVDRETFVEMATAGCSEIWMGVESGSPEILKELKKGSTIEQIAEAFRASKGLTMKRHAYLMVGAPGESRESIVETKKLLARLEPDFAAVTVFTPYPGCEVYDYAKQKQFVSDNMDWSAIDLHQTVVMPTRYLTREELEEEHIRFVRELEPYRRMLKFSVTDFLGRVAMRFWTTPPSGYGKLFKKFLSYVSARRLKPRS